MENNGDKIKKVIDKYLNILLGVNIISALIISVSIFCLTQGLMNGWDIGLVMTFIILLIVAIVAIPLFKYLITNKKNRVLKDLGARIIDNDTIEYTVVTQAEVKSEPASLFKQIIDYNNSSTSVQRNFC